MLSVKFLIVSFFKVGSSISMFSEWNVIMA